MNGQFNEKEAREEYYNASMFSLAGPLVWWPFYWLVYVVYYLVKIDTYDFTYISIKIFLMGLYGILTGFIGLETLFNIYDWWQVLNFLAEQVPYNRPTVEEVEAADRVIGNDPINIFDV